MDLKIGYMTKYSNNKEINKIVKSLLREGWTTMGKNKHLRIESPNGTKMTVPFSPSDVRAELNFKQQIRRITGINKREG